MDANQRLREVQLLQVTEDMYSIINAIERIETSDILLFYRDDANNARCITASSLKNFPIDIDRKVKEVMLEALNEYNKLRKELEII